jgi:hypothetical protein
MAVKSNIDAEYGNGCFFAKKQPLPYSALAAEKTDVIFLTRYRHILMNLHTILTGWQP